jgi:hypothetical protein
MVAGQLAKLLLGHREEKKLLLQGRKDHFLVLEDFLESALVFLNSSLIAKNRFLVLKDRFLMALDRFLILKNGGLMAEDGFLVRYYFVVRHTCSLVHCV